MDTSVEQGERFPVEISVSALDREGESLLVAFLVEAGRFELETLDSTSRCP